MIQKLLENGINEIVIPFYQIWQELVNEKNFRYMEALRQMDENLIEVGTPHKIDCK